jgi:hypothetical protein
VSTWLAGLLFLVGCFGTAYCLVGAWTVDGAAYKLFYVVVAVLFVACSAIGGFHLMRNEYKHVGNEIQECLDVGGIPDRYGRYGQHVTCRMVGEP